MGSKKRRLEAFLKLHPQCCFCGGAVKAATQDHLPPRSVFVNKLWPDGYVFPACESCNQGSSEFDSVFAMVSRFDPFVDMSIGQQEESTKLIKAFLENNSDSLPAMQLSSNEIRRWVKKANFEKAVGALYKDVPLVRVTKELNESIKNVSTKLVKALHYKHTGKIIPSDMALRVRWWSNAERMAGKFPSELLETINPALKLKSGKNSLQDQFTYGYQVSEDGNLGFYVAFFRKAFAVTGFVSFNLDVLNSKGDLLEYKDKE